MTRRLLFPLAGVLIGLLGALLVSEAILRISAAVLDPARRNEVEVHDARTVRILCVGESTTYGMWPSQLQEILNGRFPGRGVQVINRGTIGIRTDGVADEIGSWLDNYKPHLVITMLGINDEGNVLVYPRGGSRPWVVENLKTVQLVVLLWRSIFNVGMPEEPPPEMPEADAHLDLETRSRIGRFHDRRPGATAGFRYLELIEIHRELLDVDPGTPFYHLSFLRKLILETETPDRVGEFFTGQLEVDSSDLGYWEKHQEITKWAERTGNRFAGLRLAASVARGADDVRGERKLLEESTAEPAIAGFAWLRLAEFAEAANRPGEVRRCLVEADGVFSDDYPWLLLLGDICFFLGQHDLAVTHFEEALKMRPGLPASHEFVLLGWLANAYEQSGEPEGAASIRARRDELQLGRFREFTRFHYQRVVDAVRDREISVVAMQYPLLPVESLRKLLDYREDVAYVENRTNFEAALLDAGYWAVFEDRFAGSFGHLTEFGNSLVAESVAEAVERVMPKPALRQQRSDLQP